jgi:putative phage-type endonuclease
MGVSESRGEEMTVRQRKITDREEWLKWREPNINASEAGALFGIDQYCTPLMLYHRKLGTIPPEEENNAMRRGRWLEPAVLGATAEERPDLEITQPGLYFDDPALRIGCTPDGFATEKKTGRKGVVQAKTVAAHVWKEWMTTGELESPLAYELQTMVEAVHTGRADFALLSFMILDYCRIDLKIVEVPIVTKTWDAFVKRAKQFWVNLEKGIAPPVSGDDSALIKQLYPGEPGAQIDLTGNNMLPELLEKHDELKAALSAARKPLKPLEKDYDAIRTEIKGMMGDAEFALLPGGKCATLKEQTNPGWTARVLYIKELKG